MLIKYGARNFYCFKEGGEVSFELSSNCPDKISKGESVSNLLCVKGANGSGKTNILKMLSFLNDFCTNSFNEKPDGEILIFQYFDNEDPIDLYCDFKIEGVLYSYELTLNRNKVISEKLVRTKERTPTKKKRRPTSLFEREGNVLKKCINEFLGLKTIKLRSNASIISTANQYEVEELAPIYKFFAGIASNINWSGRANHQINQERVAKFYSINPDVLNFTIKIIKKFDLGINDISIHKREDEKGKELFFPLFSHDTDTDVKNNLLTFYDQSSGTKELFVILPYYKQALDFGGVLVLDEFDINLHPHILPLLVKLFDDKETNPLNAQMIFSTHHDSIIDYLGKYRTIIVNKERSESFTYRLDEVPGDILRNDRPISPIYNAGKVGGVPKV